MRNAWVTVDPRNWKTRDDITINVGLGTGGKAQQFAQVMALANVQKELIGGGKVNMVGDRELYNTAVELTRIMGYKNPDRFFNDPAAVNPQTGQLLHPLPAPPAPPPDPTVLALQAQAQVEQQEAQADAIHQKLKAEADIQLIKIKADLDAQLKVLDANLKVTVDAKKSERAAVPGTRKARDGHHYVEDPKRPGKYLLVVHHV